MEIRFSRHAKRRCGLYNIRESAITRILSGTALKHGENEVVRSIAGFKYPVKVIVSVEGDIATVVTNYPLRKGSAK